MYVCVGDQVPGRLLEDTCARLCGWHCRTGGHQYSHERRTRRSRYVRHANIPLVREPNRRYVYAVLLLLSGTPGRVYDMISRRALKLDDVKLFVLDEADEMLSRGFKEQIYDGNVCMYGGVDV